MTPAASKKLFFCSDSQYGLRNWVELVNISIPKRAKNPFFTLQLVQFSTQNWPVMGLVLSCTDNKIGNLVVISRMRLFPLKLMDGVWWGIARGYGRGAFRVNIWSAALFIFIQFTIVHYTSKGEGGGLGRAILYACQV